ncbi:hypothetical protein VTK73DRAFT_7268 [Phialemonium thermophilum]|uniref:Probable endonuclease LCL3 n=1 Tax=Phialemonium thermophilum TaxID=223376 RepID=A0ABR3WG56_9PEZI
MPWGLWSSPTPPLKGGNDNSGSSASNGDTTDNPRHASSPPSSSSLNSVSGKSPQKTRPLSWNDSLNATDWAHFTEPRNWVPTLLVTSAALGFLQFYRSYLRRIPGAGHISPGFFRRRSLLGYVTSVGDGDNFHLFHTPGGRLAGWGWLRKIPKDRKEAQGRTIHIRIAGVDAPEGAHFGRPAQPYAAEALAFLRSYILGRRVRAEIYRRDQYDRVVASVFVRRPPFFIPRHDVGLEMLRRGLATTYEARTGAEFGGPVRERKYRAVEEEARRKGRGMWAAEKGGFFGLGKKRELESPRLFKERMRTLEKDKLGS